MDARGKQDLWKQTKPEILNALKEQAIIQSAESSNRIEGVVVEEGRLVPLLAGKSEPRDRSEEEVLGYRRAMDLIFSHYATLTVSTETIQKLHKTSLGGFSGDAGIWKQCSNEIIELLPNGERVIRFVPVTPEETPSAMEQLCLGFRNVTEQRQLPDVATIAAFILDFLCIHPFRDGNGRVSRLLALLLLLQSGYEVGRYISLERLIERSKERYYETLKISSVQWHQGKHELGPFLNLFCAILKEGYSELADIVSLATDSTRALSEIVEQQILSREGSFSLKDLSAACPTASAQLIKKVLYELKAKDEVSLVGLGRGAKWRVKV